MNDGKKRVSVDADLLDRFDELCRERGEDCAHAIETMMRRSLARKAKSEQQAEQDLLDPDRMILDAKALQEAGKHVALRQDDSEFDKGKFLAHPILLALATEIALKAWQCREREGGAPDRAHDLVELFDALSADARKRLEDRLPKFETWPEVALAGQADPFGAGMRKVLEFHRKTFEAWRYSYEARALFAWTPQLDEALTAISETYNPPPVVRLGGLGNRARPALTRRPAGR